jgi:excisionase family DNA binding protein
MQEKILESTSQLERMGCREVMKKTTKSQAVDSGLREFFTVGQLADLFHLNPMTIYRIVKSGDLATYHIGCVMRFRRDDVEHFLTKHRVAARKVTRQ